MLKDTLIQVQADILNMKQESIASEKIRSDQMNYICKTVESIKTDLHECNKTIAVCISNCVKKLSTKNITFMNDIQNTVESTEQRLSKLESFLDNSNMLVVEKIGEKFYEDNDSSTLVKRPTDQNYKHNNDYNFSRQVTKDVCLETFMSTGSNYVDNNRDGNILQDELKTIPVRVTYRDEKQTDDDFVQIKRRKSRRLYVGGFDYNVTSEYIKYVANQQGATVRSVDIYPSKKSPRAVIIRLSVVDDSYCNNLLYGGVWPEGVFCKPWLSRAQLSHRHHNRHSSYDDIPPRFKHSNINNQSLRKIRYNNSLRRDYDPSVKETRNYDVD
ncbi:hypothetical protein ACF0H5_002861 [Mactra antiquata]